MGERSKTPPKLKNLFLTYFFYKNAYNLAKSPPNTLKMVPKVMGDPETENVGSGIFDFFSRIPEIVDFRKKLNFFNQAYGT